MKRLRTERRRTKTERLRAEETTAWEDPHAGPDTQDLLESLTSAHREILVLRCLEGHSITQIAELLRLREGTVKSRLSRGLRAARKKLES